MLLGWFKNIYDTVERICGSECVQTGKDEMTGFGSCHGSLNGLVITHFAKKNDIRALAKGSTQGSNIIFCISAYLTLAYDTTIVSMQVFQRIFQRNDMPFARMVDSIYKAGHGCGFSASGRSGYKNHAFCQISNTHDILGNRKLGGIRQLESDNTYDCCQRTTLFVSIDTKT